MKAEQKQPRVGGEQVPRQQAQRSFKEVNTFSKDSVLTTFLQKVVCMCWPQGINIYILESPLLLPTSTPHLRPLCSALTDAKTMSFHSKHCQDSWPIAHGHRWPSYSAQAYLFAHPGVLFEKLGGGSCGDNELVPALLTGVVSAACRHPNCIVAS